MPPGRTLHLRCQTVVDGHLAYVLVPVDRARWEADEPMQESVRRRAREELRHRAVLLAGHDLPADRFDALPVWVEYPDRCEVECVGGPHDGKRITWPSAEPPLGIQLPIDEGTAALIDARPAESSTRTVLYEPLFGEGGFVSRTNDGAWRYRSTR
ncbi:hypothetical protein [Streptomyces sp. NPDC047315]|uniref:hypothetical protein n=1 Tax=Streptomyces sp. NPDC047315 TaxID=3155142 RepID=UPI0033F927B3